MTQVRHSLIKALAVADECDDTLLGALIAECLDQLARGSAVPSLDTLSDLSEPGN